jgi:hypothetical protein
MFFVLVMVGEYADSMCLYLMDETTNVAGKRGAVQHVSLWREGQARGLDEFKKEEGRGDLK